MSDIDRVLDRVRQNTAARMAALERQRAASTPGVTRVNGQHAIGARVFDPVTGQEGEVIGGGSQNLVVPTTKR